jgi:hypothetical protein
MVIRKRATRWLGPMLFALASACAAREARSYEAVDGVRVAIDQRAVPVGSLRIWLTPENGSPRLLGTTDGFGVDTLRVAFALGADSYRLVAELAGGRQVASNLFTVTAPRLIVSWNLATNTVFVKAPPP